MEHFIINCKAPDIFLEDYNLNIFSLNQTNGKWLLLFFYTNSSHLKDWMFVTEFIRNHEILKKENIMVYGVGCESLINQFNMTNKFRGILNDNIKLLRDPNYRVFYKYNYLLLKNFLNINVLPGKNENIRNTFLIDPFGNIRYVWLGYMFGCCTMFIRKTKELKLLFDLKYGLTNIKYKTRKQKDKTIFVMKFEKDNSL